jgi:hypothetical protein
MSVGPAFVCIFWKWRQQHDSSKLVLAYLISALVNLKCPGQGARFFILPKSSSHHNGLWAEECLSFVLIFLFAYTFFWGLVRSLYAAIGQHRVATNLFIFFFPRKHWTFPLISEHMAGRNQSAAVITNKSGWRSFPIVTINHCQVSPTGGCQSLSSNKTPLVVMTQPAWLREGVTSPNI